LRRHKRDSKPRRGEGGGVGLGGNKLATEGAKGKTNKLPRLNSEFVSEGKGGGGGKSFYEAKMCGEDRTGTQRKGFFSFEEDRRIWH